MTVPEIINFWISQTIRFISPLMTALEWALAALIALAVFTGPRRPWRWLERVAGGFVQLATHSRLAVAICAGLPLLVRVALLGVYPVHEPSIHDEFSHLLLADTLAHGRLSNPTHPLWRHFESIHIIQQPTYSSMYPPANGILLAAGQVVFHEPWAGELMAASLMFGALCWMMRQWVPAVWAFYGALIAICRIGILSPWVDSYLGGPVSALGGALVIGSVPALRKGRRPATYSALFGAGSVILMNSRPFDGAILCAAAFLYLLPSLVRNIRSAGVWTSRPLWGPALALLLVGAAFTGYYSWRVTGHPARLPYQVNRDAYGWPENLAFLPVRVVTLRHQTMKDMYAMEVARRRIFSKWNTYVDDMNRRAFENWMFFVGPLLTIPLIAAVGAIRSPGTGPLIAFLSLIGCLNLFQLVLYPYHLGPVVPIIYTFTASGVMKLWTEVRRTRPGGAQLALVLLPLTLLFTGVLKANADTLALPITYWERSAEAHGIPRASIEHWLSTRPRKQLVIVRYASGHSPNQEWVYNRADIDGSKVVWAREMNPADDQELLRYFHDREVWLLQADVWPQHVVPWSLAVRFGCTPNPIACSCEISESATPDEEAPGRGKPDAGEVKDVPR